MQTCVHEYGLTTQQVYTVDVVRNNKQVMPNQRPMKIRHQIVFFTSILYYSILLLKYIMSQYKAV